MSDYSSIRRDKAIADEFIGGTSKDLMCTAHGCPNPWSVDAEGRFCSAHFRQPPHLWPQITQEQHDYIAMRASRKAEPAKTPTHAEKRAILAKLRGLRLGADHDSKAWADELESREQSGEMLTSAQRVMWRGAKGVRA